MLSICSNYLFSWSPWLIQKEFIFKVDSISLHTSTHIPNNIEDKSSRSFTENIIYFIGPGVLAYATCGGGRSEAGYCFHLLFFFFFFYAFWFSLTSGILRELIFFLEPDSCMYFLLFTASVRSRSLDQPLVPGRSEAGYCFHLLFFFFFFFFFSAFYFSPTSGNLPCVKICFPQYFGITRRYLQNKYCFYNFTSYWPFLKQKV